MLNGLDPIILFNFKKKLSAATEASIAQIPIVSSVYTTIGLPPIPIYLSENLTGLFIDSEDKTIDIKTEIETLPNGATPIIKQKGLGSTTRINLKANKNSIGIMLLTALSDLLLEKATSQEYSITYLHGPITVFGGLLESFQVTQSAENDLLNIVIELSRGGGSTKEASTVPEVGPVRGAVPL